MKSIMSISAFRTGLSRIFSSKRIVFSNLSHKTSFSTIQKSSQTNARSLCFLSRNSNCNSYSELLFPATYNSSRGAHSRGAEELSSYLKEEIQSEKQNERKVSDELRGFVFTASEADVKLQKKDGNETITITANVNDSVDAEDSVQDPNVEPTETKMLSKPDFTVEITKGHRIVSFHCTFNQTLPEDQPGDEPYSDVFQISEISVYDGEFKDSTYTVSGDIMDGYLYDLLLNYLEEKGITNEFADEMVELFTAYEHKLYINLLEKLNKYFGK